MASDEKSIMTVLNVQTSSTNQTNSTPVSSLISLTSAPIVDHMSEWNLYFKSLYLTASELPYFNALRNSSFDDQNYEFSNFQTNRMNLAVVLSSATPIFDTSSNTYIENVGLMFPMGVQQTTKWTQMGCFCQYVSENSTLTTPLANGTGVSSANYPRGYWNIHSISQFLDLVNTAIANILRTGNLSIDDIFFTYQADTGLYNLTMSDAIISDVGEQNIQLFMNSQCERYFDFFRFGFQSQYTDLTLPPNGLQRAGYSGAFSNCMDYLFIPTTTGLANYTTATTQWNFLSENECVSLLIDTHSLIISIPSGSLSNARTQIIPANNGYTNSSLLPPSKRVLKIVDLNPTVGSGINNATLIATADILDMPINLPSYDPLQQIELLFEIMTCDNYIIPISINGSQGWSGIRFVLKKRDEILKK